jgi:hypothetical protein
MRAKQPGSTSTTATGSPSFACVWRTRSDHVARVRLPSIP